MSLEWAFGVGVVIALAVGMGVLVSRRAAIWQTTLVSAWWWTLAAVVSWSGVELIAAVDCRLARGGGSLEPLRLAAIALSFCPVVAVLGAKRPQDRAWSFVVVSLWGIVALPAAEAFFLQRGERVSVGDARSWFLWILILLGPINFVATRYWLGSLLVAGGQVMACSPYLALVQRPLLPQGGWIGLLLCVAGMVVAWLAFRRVRVTAYAYDRLWLDFRDSFGLLWALRVQERVNAVAKQKGWGIELGWNGFRSLADGAPLATIEPAMERTLRTTIKGLLRRFGSSLWLAERLDGVAV
jgi:hypothetical protein